MAKIKIPKLEAARRQLETAIELYFEDRDFVSIHALASAASTVISDVSESRGGRPTFIEDMLAIYVKPNFQKEVRAKLFDARNFFKHAERDPERELEFNPDVNDFVLVGACDGYRVLTDERPPKMVLFQSWFLFRHRRFMLPDPQMEKILEQLPIDSVSKAEFWDLLLPSLALKLNVREITIPVLP
jgi:hypothetical protein